MNAAAWRAWFASAVARHAQRYGYGFVPVTVIVAQAALESAHFSSAIFRENRNAFGLKEPRIRPTTATGTNRGHATYESVDACIVDYFLRQRYFRIPATVDYMARTVESGYATEPTYAARWIAALEAGAGMPSPVSLVAPFVIPLLACVEKP